MVGYVYVYYVYNHGHEDDFQILTRYVKTSINIPEEEFGLRHRMHLEILFNFFRASQSGSVMSSFCYSGNSTLHPYVQEKARRRFGLICTSWQQL